MRTHFSVTIDADIGPSSSKYGLRIHADGRDSAVDATELIAIAAFLHSIALNAAPDGEAYNRMERAFSDLLAKFQAGDTAAAPTSAGAVLH